ncbi:hypothetical protein CL629_01345 [bacterium]|nr:hypothetical protein [bacterium]|tara:strand:+ start:2974 stop:3843 length:870 start_codon:yes stop_codon:yes gene_type:complete
MFDLFADFTSSFERLFGEESIYRGAIFGALTLFIFWVLYKLSTRALRKYLRRALKWERAQHFLLVWRYVWIVIAVIFVGISFSGSIATLGISAAFLGMILGWSLQAPVTGVAAWLMIVLKRPFRIGDRIIVSDITGDVVDITMTHIVLNQVGGTIGGEEKSGRGVYIPNATLFKEIIYNYSFESRYLLDEVNVLVTYESDSKEAEKILISAASKVTKEIIEATEDEPFVRMELADSGVKMKLRYKAFATERQRISSEIVQYILKEFSNNKKVEFAYPHTEVVYRGESDK